MKTAVAKADSKKLAEQVQAARLQVATAKNRWQATRERARLAKRRRKEAKIIARRAKKQAHEARADLAEAKQVLANAEAKLAKPSVRAATRKPARPTVASHRKQAAPARKRRTVRSALSPAPGPAAQVKLVSSQESAASPILAQAGIGSGKPAGAMAEPAMSAEVAVEMATRPHQFRKPSPLTK